MIKDLAETYQEADYIAQWWVPGYRGSERLRDIYRIAQGQYLSPPHPSLPFHPSLLSLLTTYIYMICQRSFCPVSNLELGTRQIPAITADFSHLKMLGHVYVVEDAKDLAQIVKDAARYGGAYRPEVSAVFPLSSFFLLPFLCCIALHCVCFEIYAGLIGRIRVHPAALGLEEDREDGR